MSFTNSITRSIINGHYIYKNITKQSEIDRINGLCIPPAWTDVCINPNKNHDLLATGIDKSGKMQYIYNKKFIKMNTAKKFIRLGIFINHKHKITQFVSKNLNISCGVTENFIMALLYEILLLTGIRVGNDVYNTYGLTTLEKRHIIFKEKGEEEKEVVLAFIGKKNIKQSISITNTRVISALKFLYSRAKNSKIFEPITSIDLNNNLKLITKEELTCKDFRTYVANKSFIKYLIQGHTVKDTIKLVSKELGHGENIFKKSYVMPELLTTSMTNKNPDVIILETIMKHYSFM
jgi:DNA topoisomerase-1